jgi:hypothetical protein
MLFLDVKRVRHRADEWPTVYDWHPIYLFFFASVLSKYYFIVFSCIRVNIPLEVEERIPVSFQSTTNRKTRPKKDCTK